MVDFSSLAQKLADYNPVLVFNRQFTRFLPNFMLNCHLFIQSVSWAKKVKNYGIRIANIGESRFTQQYKY